MVNQPAALSGSAHAAAAQVPADGAELCFCITPDRIIRCGAYNRTAVTASHPHKNRTLLLFDLMS